LNIFIEEKNFRKHWSYREKKKRRGGGTQPTNIWWTINGQQLWALFEQEKSFKGMDNFIYMVFLNDRKGVEPGLKASHVNKKQWQPISFTLSFHWFKNEKQFFNECGHQLHYSLRAASLLLFLFLFSLFTFFPLS